MDIQLKEIQNPGGVYSYELKYKWNGHSSQNIWNIGFYFAGYSGISIPSDERGSINNTLNNDYTINTFTGVSANNTLPGSQWSWGLYNGLLFLVPKRALYGKCESDHLTKK